MKLRTVSLTLLILITAILVEGQSNPRALVNQPLTPSGAKPNTSGLILTVNGSDFVPGSVVEWNFQPRPTTFTSATQLQAAISSSDLATPGTATVVVANPAPGGGLSNFIYFPVANAPASIQFSRSQVPLGFYPESLVAGDFNHDGKIDVVGANDQTQAFINSALGNGDGTFRFEVDQPIFCQIQSLSVGYFGSDGNLSVLSHERAVGQMCLFHGMGDGSFDRGSSYSGGGRSNTTPVSGDFNLDGSLDAVVAHPNDNTVDLLLGQPDGFLSEPIRFPAGFSPKSATVGDFNGDGFLDVAVGNPGSVSVLLGNGKGGFNALIPTAARGNNFFLVAADVNQDGILDLITANVQGFTVLFGNGDATFRVGGQITTSAQPKNFKLGDFNNDGKIDLVVSQSSGSSSGLISILFGNGDGTFGPPVDFLTSVVPYSFDVADFNSDGLLDIIVGDTSDGVSLYLQVP